MSTASAPNRFWEVVALALNSIVQPAGQICGGTDSPALRLSPPFQIANALSLIYHSVRLSYAIDQPFREAVGVVAEQAHLYYGIAEPERRSYFRAYVFIFGALPAFIKAMAIQGDRLSYWLALGFFVPYLVLEFIDLLRKPPSWDSRADMPADTSLNVIVFRLFAAVLALGIHVDFCMEMIKSTLRKTILGTKAFEADTLISTIAPLIAIYGGGMLKFYEWAPKHMHFLLLGISLIVTFCLLGGAFIETIKMWGRWSEVAITVLALTVAITGTLAHLFIYLRSTSIKPRQFISGENRHKQKFFEQWIALWTVTCIFLYYGYLYDASGTYKPAWTEWLP